MNSGNKGILNLGATCYLNSVVQCLSHLLFFHPLNHKLNETYKDLCTLYNGNFCLVDTKKKNNINMKNFKLFIKKLSETETYRLQNILHIRNNQEKKWSRIYKSTENKIELENHTPIIFRDKEKKIFQDMSNWKHRYYLQTIFNETDINYDLDNLNKHIQHISNNYIQSILWTLNYYINGCDWWDFSYEYIVAPSLDDVFKYLDMNIIELKINKTPYTPEQQLKMVLPIKSHNLINESFEYDPILYPQKPQSCYILKRYLWEQHLYLPKLQ